MARLELSDMIVGLRKEVIEAQKKAENESLKFKVDTIEVEAQVTVTKEAGVDGKVKWGFWVFTEAEAGATGSIGRETVQTIKLTLTPHADDGGDIYVSDEVTRPSSHGGE